MTAAAIAVPLGDTEFSVENGSLHMVFAEANALLFASPQDREGATIYTSAAPCFSCAKLIANSGIKEVVASGGRYDGWDETRLAGLLVSHKQPMRNNFAEFRMRAST